MILRAAAELVFVPRAVSAKGAAPETGCPGRLNLARPLDTYSLQNGSEGVFVAIPTAETVLAKVRVVDPVQIPPFENTGPVTVKLCANPISKSRL